MTTSALANSRRVRILIGSAIMLIIAGVHAFRVGSFLEGQWYIWYYSFASDIMLPFGAYFMLGMNELQFKFLKSWKVKGLMVFGAMTFSELLQYFEIYFFGVTFDPLDILMFAIGTLLGIVTDIIVFANLIPHWKYNN